VAIDGKPESFIVSFASTSQLIDVASVVCKEKIAIKFPTEQQLLTDCVNPIHDYLKTAVGQRQQLTPPKAAETSKFQIVKSSFNIGKTEISYEYVAGANMKVYAASFCLNNWVLGAHLEQVFKDNGLSQINEKNCKDFIFDIIGGVLDTSVF
jgi:hypothetical protein